MKLILLVDSYKPGMKSLWLVLTNYIILMIIAMTFHDDHDDDVDDQTMMIIK